MKIGNIRKAKNEAIKFLQMVEQVEKEQNYRFMDDESTTTTSKETGALKRSSMDLTRSLSKMRNDIW